MSFVSGVIAGLTNGWDASVTSAPEFLNGARETNTRRRRKKYKNVVFVYDAVTNYQLVEPTHTYKDGVYRGRLEIISAQSESKRDNIVSECIRIIGQTGIAGYDNKQVISEYNYGDTSKWNSKIYIQLVKYNESI